MENKIFECDICKKTFEKSKSMTGHRRWHKIPKYKEFQERYRLAITKKDNNIELFQKEKQILLGSLLGDGGLRIEKNGVNAVYREQHSYKQKLYLLWKAAYLKNLSVGLGNGKTFDKRTNKQYSYTFLWSKAHPILTEFYKMFYTNKKKIITETIMNQLEALGLAIWYMDDGYYHYGDSRCYLSTHAFSFEEHILLKEWFHDKWGIKIQIRREKATFIVCFNKENAHKFLTLIEPFVIESMNYKLGHLRNENSMKINEKYNRILERTREYRIKNRDKVLESLRKSYRKHCEKYLKKKKELYWRNPEYYRKKKMEDYWKRKERVLIDKSQI